MEARGKKGGERRKTEEGGGEREMEGKVGEMG